MLKTLLAHNRLINPAPGRSFSLLVAPDLLCNAPNEMKQPRLDDHPPCSVLWYFPLFKYRYKRWQKRRRTQGFQVSLFYSGFLVIFFSFISFLCLMQALFCVWSPVRSLISLFGSHHFFSFTLVAHFFHFGFVHLQKPRYASQNCQTAGVWAV